MHLYIHEVFFQIFQKGEHKNPRMKNQENEDSSFTISTQRIPKLNRFVRQPQPTDLLYSDMLRWPSFGAAQKINHPARHGFPARPSWQRQLSHIFLPYMIYSSGLRQQYTTVTGPGRSRQQKICKWFPRYHARSEPQTTYILGKDIVRSLPQPGGYAPPSDKYRPRVTAPHNKGAKGANRGTAGSVATKKQNTQP